MGTGGNNPERKFERKIIEFIEDLERHSFVYAFESGGSGFVDKKLFKYISKNVYEVQLGEFVARVKFELKK
jgi:hypothetical protein